VERARLESMRRAVRGLGIGGEVGGVGESTSYHQHQQHGGIMANGGLVNGFADHHHGHGMDVAGPLPTVERARFHDVTDEDVEEGPGAVEDSEAEGVVLSNGEVAAKEVPPADELAQESMMMSMGGQGDQAVGSV
jgi:hypothetical protein